LKTGVCTSTLAMRATAHLFTKADDHLNELAMIAATGAVCLQPISLIPQQTPTPANSILL